MRKISLLVATCATFFPCALCAQNWQFLETAGSYGNDGSTAIAVDPSGSASYAAGTFTDSITFGQIAFGSGNTPDGYMAKYSSNGTVQWAVHINATNDVQVTDMVFAVGYVYLSGYFNGAIAVGNDTVASVGGSDIFVGKLNATTGVVSWLIRIGGPEDDRAETITFGSNALYLGGSFEDSWMFGVDSLQSCGGADALIAALDLAGMPLWSRTGGGVNDEQVVAITSDISGNCYAVGSFSGTTSFGLATLSSAGLHDLFVLKYDASGAWGWIRSVYGTDEESAVDATSDLFGQVYVVGTFTSPNLNLMSQTIVNTDSLSGFLAAYDASGYVSWVRAYPRFLGQGVTCTNTSICVAGMFADSCTIGLQTFISQGATDICIVKCSSLGIFLGAHQCGGIGNEDACAVSIDQNNTVYLAGSFSGQQTYFAPYSVSNTDTTGQTTDAYVGKFPASLLAVDEHVLDDYLVYPNPFTTAFTVVLPASAHEVTLCDITGKEIIRTSGVGCISVDGGTLARGVYILVVTDTEGVCVVKQLISAQ